MAPSADRDAAAPIVTRLRLAGRRVTGRSVDRRRVRGRRVRGRRVDGGSMDRAMLARSHGWFNVVGGLWPLMHMPSFERVLGPKTDRWLVRTVAGLMVCNGIAQIRSAGSAEGVAAARRIGLGTASTFAAVDLIYAPAGRISKMYLLDAVLECGWVLAWGRQRGAPYHSG